MTFLEGSYLWLAAFGAVILLPGLWCIRRDGKRLRAFSVLHAVLSDGPGTGRRILGLLLTCGVFVAVALALAGPVQDEGEVALRREGLDLVFAVDTSRSMLAADGRQTRLDRAVQEAASFLDVVGGDRVGLVAFAGAASMVCPLTHDLEGFETFLRRLDVYAVDEGGSSLSRGIDGAVKAFDDEAERRRVVVLISDGEDLGRDPGRNPGDGLDDDPGRDREADSSQRKDPVAAASRAREEGITLCTLMVGQAGGARIALDDGFLMDERGEPVRSKPDPTALRRIAAAGGGAFVDAGDAAFPMELLYSEHLALMKRTSFGGTGAVEGKAAFQGILLLALLLFLFELYLPCKRKTGRPDTVDRLQEADRRDMARRNTAHRKTDPKPVRAKGAALLAVILAALPCLGTDESDTYRVVREGIEHYRQGMFARARTAFEQALTLKPDHPEVLHNLGLAHLALNELDRAASCFDQAIASGKVQVVLPARFGAGLAACRSAGKALRIAGERLDPAGEPGERSGSDGAAALHHAVKQAQSAGRFFAASLEHGFWPREAAVNLEEANRLRKKAEEALTALGGDGAGETAGDGRDREGMEPEGTGGAANREEGEGMGEETVHGDPGRSGMGEGAEALLSPVPMTEEAKARIYSQLDGMEKTRSALERARVKLHRKKSGGRDW